MFTYRTARHLRIHCAGRRANKPYLKLKSVQFCLWPYSVCRCISVCFMVCSLFPLTAALFLSDRERERAREGERGRERDGGNWDTLLLCAVHFTRSAPIPQPHLSSHELMSWKRVQPSLGLLPLVLSAACTIFPHEILQPARDTAKAAGKQLGWALMIYSYISAIIPTRGGVAESRIWWLHWCCLR